MKNILFVTGRLAQNALRRILEMSGVSGDVFVLPIDVASLANTKFISKHLAVGDDYDYVMIPGLCAGETDCMEEKLGTRVIRGPQDLLDIPEFLGKKKDVNLDSYDVRIFAEINEAPFLSLEEIAMKAQYYRSCGANVIDIGCSPKKGFHDLGRVVAKLKEMDFILSIDTMNPKEMLLADDAGIDYALSLNSQNMHVADSIECTPILIPDGRNDVESLEKNIALLEQVGKRFIIDPILDPLNFGFVDSLERYMRIRKKHPECEMLLGVGNVTELCDADSTGMNFLLCGIAEELSIENVLTTEASQKTCGSVRELDIARRMTFYAKKNGILPRRITDKLLVAKDEKRNVYTEEELKALQKSLNPKDEDFRIFVSDEIYVFNGRIFVSSKNKKEIFERLEIKDSRHAFYLGMELERAELALRLGKKYIQEQDLRWGYMGEKE